MGLALAAADLAVARAGAATLGELPLFGLPGVLVPYPHAWRYQKVNAEYLVARGGAVSLEDGEAATRLVPLIRQLLGDPERLDGMRQAMRQLARPNAAAEIAAEVTRLLVEGGGRG
jgi:UDP-N-acetylglucosamine--N-acetylmuramyl-(pentapeptide) pyrophosphoryl-undecaprenol N-acetylglucosamine transferase